MSQRAYQAWLYAQSNGAGDGPDIRGLWSNTPIAKKAYRCDRCGGQLNAGQRYSSVGVVEDGVFRHERSHLDAWRYPSGCPEIGARDRAEEQRQYDQDRCLFAAQSNTLS